MKKYAAEINLYNYVQAKGSDIANRVKWMRNDMVRYFLRQRTGHCTVFWRKPQQM